MRLFGPLEDTLIADRRGRQCAAKQFVAALFIRFEGGGVLIGHDATISALNALTRTPFLELPDVDHASHQFAESERSAMILAAALIEDTLTRALSKLMPGIRTRQDRKAMFEANAPLQSFSAKITMAVALGIIDKDLQKKIDIIRCMRNAAAHAAAPMTYDRVEVRNAIALLFGQDRADEVATWGRVLIRITHSAVCAQIGNFVLTGNPYENFDQVFMMGQSAHAKNPGWPDTPPPQSPQDHHPS